MHRISRPVRIVMVLVSLVFLATMMSGCFGGGSNAGSYNVSGRVLIIGGNSGGLGDVALGLSNISTVVKTDASGRWAATGLKGTVTVTPRKDGWIFEPASRQVSSASSSVDFIAKPADYMGLRSSARWEYNVQFKEDGSLVGTGDWDKQVVLQASYGSSTRYYILEELELDPVEYERVPSNPVGLKSRLFGSLRSPNAGGASTALGDRGTQGLIYSREGSSYYEIGMWGDDPSDAYLYPGKVLLVRNPIAIGDAGFGDATACRQEKVTTPAGTFDAWVFRGHIYLGEIMMNAETWMAPNVGVVKEYWYGPGAYDFPGYVEFTLSLKSYSS